MPATLPPPAKALIDRPNFAHLATLMADGSQHRARSGSGARGTVSWCTSEDALKGRNTPSVMCRVALSIVDFHNPYEEVQLRGRVVERRPDPDLKFMDPVSHKYIGKPFPMRSARGPRGAGDRDRQGPLHEATVRAHAAAAVALGQRQRLLRPHQHQRLDRVHPVLARPQRDRRRAHQEGARIPAGRRRPAVAQRTRRGHESPADLDDGRVAAPRRSTRRSTIGPWLSWIAWSCTPKPGMPQNIRVRCASQSMK